MKTLADSFLILRNVDFVAKYFPYFLQTSIRATFKVQICYPDNYNLVFNSTSQKSTSTGSVYAERFFADELSPRNLKPDSASYNSVASDPKRIFIERKFFLTSI